MDASLYLLFGRTRASVLKLLHDAADRGEPFHLREIARQTRLSPTAVQYELRLLSQLDMIRNVGTYARPQFVLNREHALYSSLHAVFADQEEPELIQDDAHFARKRIQQRKDRRASNLDNSPFLRQWGTLANSVKVL
ncbi:MAG: hypothetical protein ACT4P9_01760 [Betaproteobacteria bacterium]